MKRIAAVALMLCSLAAWAAESGRPETPILQAQDYRVPLDQVIVTVPEPYWKTAKPPRWDQPKIDLHTESSPSRMQWMPRYTRDERDDYRTPHDNLELQPRIKLFELRF